MKNIMIEFLIRLKRFIIHRKFKLFTYQIIKDLEKNEKILKELDFDIEFIRSTLASNNLNYNDPKLSWHYHLFSAISKNKKKLKILEIGTHLGKFTNFLSKIFENSEIHSVDLPHNDDLFINSYFRNDLEYKKKFLKDRAINLKRDNISFYEMNSVNLINVFTSETFDIIWLDGDHSQQQVSIDTFSAYLLLKKGGLLICDDIMFQKNGKNRFKEADGFKSIHYLSKIKNLKTDYLVKRMHFSNAYYKKYISLTVKA